MPLVMPAQSTMQSLSIDSILQSRRFWRRGCHYRQCRRTYRAAILSGVVPHQAGAVIVYQIPTGGGDSRHELDTAQIIARAESGDEQNDDQRGQGQAGEGVHLSAAGYLAI